MAIRAFGIYIHIPYCFQKCDYCDFYSIEKKLSEIEINTYLSYLEKDLLKKKKYLEGDPIHPPEESQNNFLTKDKYLLKTIFFGGGTPSILDPKYIKEILTFIYKNFNTKYLEEISIEANPESLTYTKIKAYKKIGINRLNIGVQSRSESELKYLGRYYSSKKLKQLFYNIQKTQFKNYGVDFIIDIPDQQWKNIKKDLNWAITNHVTHISVYSLTVEEETPLYQQIKLKKKKNQEEHYLQNGILSAKTKLYLEQKDYYQYEVSNYSKKKYRSYHNMLYWKNRPYIGIGTSAHSLIHDKRYENQKAEDKDFSSNYLITFLELEDLFINGFRITSYQSFHYYKIQLKKISKRKNLELNGNYHYEDIIKIFYKTFYDFNKRKYLKLFTNGFQIIKNGLIYSDSMVSEIYENFSEYEDKVKKLTKSTS